MHDPTAQLPSHQPARGSMLTRAIDSTIRALAPGWAMKRAHARAALDYADALAAHAAAEHNRTTADWKADALTADQANLPELSDITARARASVRNDWVGASIIRTYRRNVVGKGITASAAAMRDGNPDEALSDQLTRSFRRWGRNPDLVDVQGRKTLHDFMLLAIAEKKAVGSTFVVWSHVPRRTSTAAGLSLQAFEVEQLATERDRIGKRDTNEIRNGIEIDRNGRPMAYHVHLEKHPMEGFGDGRERITRIDAHRVIHLGHQSRVLETLAVSEMAPVLHQMWNRQGYDHGELLAKKLESFLAFAIKRGPQSAPTPMGYTATASAGSASDPQTGSNESEYRRMNFAAGLMPVLGMGEEIQGFHWDRPGANYDRYMYRQIGGHAAGVGLGYNTVARDWANTSYASLRQGVLEDGKEYDLEQLHLIDHMLRPLWVRYVTFGVMEGKFSAPGFLTDPVVAEDLLEVDFQPPERPWIDPAKQAAAMKIMLDYQLINRDDIMNERGVDWREHLRKVDAIKKFADRLGIEFAEDKADGPAVSPSEPKVHGTGDDDADTGDAPRTQSALDDDEIVTLLHHMQTHDPVRLEHVLALVS